MTNSLVENSSELQEVILKAAELGYKASENGEDLDELLDSIKVS